MTISTSYTRYLRSCVGLVAIFSIYVSGASAQGCPDYFASEWSKPLDMSAVGDVNDSFTPLEQNQVGPYRYTNGIFSTTTTGTDPWIQILTRAVNGSIADRTTRYGDLHPINPATYNQLVIRMNTDRASSLQVFWSKQDGTIGSTGFTRTSVGWNTYTINLNTSNWGGGANYAIRIDPTIVQNALIQIDYIYLTPAGCNSPDLKTAPVLQPDREGGEDHYASIRGNPANFNTVSDIEYTAGNSSSTIYPGNTYMDSGGTIKKQDFLEGVSNTSDPVVVLTNPGTKYRIDANRFKIACWTIDLLRPTNIYHSLVRLFWVYNDQYFNTDDVLTKTTGEARYCLRMDTVALEPALAAGAVHPWRNNSSGLGVDYFRLDPSEDSEATTYRINDVRLAADHEADNQFAIVIGGDRSAAVTVRSQKDSDTPVDIATLPTNRNTNVVLWNTQSLAEGSYYIFTTTGINTAKSEAPVLVSHTARAHDNYSPVLHVDSPVEGHRFNNQLQITGYVVDEMRVATVEVLIDGTLYDSFVPSLFDQRARDAFPNIPFSSSAGFERFVDTTALAAGNHTVTVNAFDTAGHLSSFTATVVKAGDNLTANFVPPFTEAAGIPMNQGVQPTGETKPTAIPTPTPAINSGKASLSFRASGSNLLIGATGTQCTRMRLFASVSATTQATLSAKGMLLDSVNGNVLRGSGKNIPTLSQSRKIYFLADCGPGSKGSVKSLDVRSFSGRRTTTVTRVFRFIVKYYRHRN